MSANGERIRNDKIIHDGCGGEIVVHYARSYDCGDYLEYEVELECLKCKKLFERNNY